MKTKVNKHFLVALFFLLAIIALYYPLISDQVLAVRGDGLGYVTGKEFMMNSLRAGEIPFWNPYSGIGTPFLADVQNTVFSPFNILYVLFDTVLAFNLMRITQLFIAGFSMYLLMDELVKERVVAMVIGLIYCFSTMLGGNRIEHHTFATTIAMFPMVLYFIEKFRSTRCEKWLAFSSISMAIQFLSGFTQICLYFDILAFVYLAYVLWENDYPLKTAFFQVVKWGMTYLLLIAVQLLPLLQLMGQSGRNKVSWEFFSEYSYDLRLLLMMLFPYAYSNDTYNKVVFDQYHSSEMDIEIYIGIICLIYIAYEVLYHYREKKIRLISNIAVGAFVFGMAPHIPIIGKLVYYTPILGSFRCSARSISLFLFLAFILFGLGLANIKDKIELKKIIKVNLYFVFLLGTNFFIMLCIFSQSQIFSTEKLVEYRTKFSMCTFAAFFMCLLNYALLRMVYCWGEKNCIRKIIIVVIGITIISDVSRFSMLERKLIGDSQDILSSGLTDELSEYINSDTAGNYRSFVALKDSSDLVQPFARMGQAGRALYHEKMLYNSYITFLDNKFDYWGVKETLAFPEFITMVSRRNDFVSMLGVRHILDYKEARVGIVSGNEADKNTVLDIKDITMPKAPGISAYALEAEWVAGDAAYEILVECGDGEVPEFFHIDFYGQNYDNFEQEAVLQKTDKNNVYRAVVTTNDISIEGPVYFRVLGTIESDFHIKNIKVSSMKAEKSLKEHEITGGSIAVFENINARQLLYVPEHVYSIESYGSSPIVARMKDVDKNNYIVDFHKEMDLKRNGTELNNINMKRNAIKANIMSQDVTFVNFSQLSYPGWNAYVDGKRVKCYTVNNLIMGAEVPAGNHEIEFRFEPIDVKVGFIVTLIGIIWTLIWIFNIKRWRRKK